ncbi:MAG: Multidrug resistance protein MdtA [Phycisphaerae bacterium]|nr:Multidrug resistance protein MdtA [Phycisphaerae bacterium]
MAITNDERARTSSETDQYFSEALLPAAEDSSPAELADQPAELPPAHRTSSSATVASPRRHRLKKWAIAAVVVAGLAVAGYYYLLPIVDTALNAVSTDDAYVNGHATFVASRVSGQVTKVLVDDNQRVKKGDVLVQLDPEPYDVQVNIAKAAVDAARADLEVVRAQTRGLQAQISSQHFALLHAIEEVDNQIALLHARVATLNARQATFDNAEYEYHRIERLFKTSVANEKEMEDATAALKVAQAQVDEAREAIYQVRVALGLPRSPESGDLTEVPPNLDQTFSVVRQTQASLIQAAAQLGVNQPLDDSPRDMVAKFQQRDPEGNIDRIFAMLLEDAPAVRQAQARLASAQRRLNEAELNRRYCDIVSEIDGVVTRRNVNPGNTVQAGQALMAVRSLTEIWIDANFKETQLADLRIGQRVSCKVDMYGHHREFEGRITGFTMGTGQTLALLPPQNATGNFVKIIQRLPVRIELLDYNPDEAPLFVGLSVEPFVYFKEPPTGPHAGEILQPLADLPSAESGTTTGIATSSAKVNES